MILTARKLPSLQAWQALEKARLIPTIQENAMSAIHGYDRISCPKSERLSLPYEFRKRAALEYHDATLRVGWSSLRELSAEDHPHAIAFGILQKKIFKYEKFGFASPCILASHVAACAEVLRGHDSSSSDVWMNSCGRFSAVLQNTHGDLALFQTALPSEEDAPEHPHFFEKLGFPRKKKGAVSQGAHEPGVIAALHAYQDWSPLLASLLLFAEHIGQENIFEIQQYKKVLRSLSCSTANTSEAYGSNHDGLQLYFECDALFDGNNPRPSLRPILFLPAPQAEAKKYYWPAVHDEVLYFPSRELLGLTTKNAHSHEETAEALLRHVKDAQQRETLVHFTKEDLPHALRACYRLFSRDPSKRDALLEMFLQKQAYKEVGSSRPHNVRQKTRVFGM